MNNVELLLLIIICTIITAIIRTSPLFIKLPENNKIINKFFEALPFSVLTLLIFPGIFTAGGNTKLDYLKILIGILVILYLSIKKYGLGIVVTISMIIIFIFDIIKKIL